MKKKLLIPVIAILGIFAVVSVQSQSPQSSTPSYPSTGSSIDNQGVRDYKLGPGDILDVRIWGQPELNSPVEIDEDGNLSSLAFIEDPIPAKCRTVLEIQKSVADAYSKFLLKPRVSVRIAERRSRPPATIYGSVYKPTAVSTIRRLRLHEMIAQAGGFTATAGGIVQIIHTAAEVCPEPGMATAAAKGSDIGEINTYQISLLKSGAADGDPFIRPGDILYVVEGDPVYITGLVFNPQTLITHEPITLSRALAQAGGTQRLANTKEIHILRKKDGKMAGNDIKINYDAIKKGQQDDVVLQPYDVVDVREVGFFAPKNLGDMLKGLPLQAVTKIP